MAAVNIQDVVSDDLNYEQWAPNVKTRLVEIGVWDVVVNGVPPDPTKNPELAATINVVDLAQWRNSAIKDMKALKVLHSSLPDSTYRKTFTVSSAKELWDLLEKGNEEAKLRRLEKQFEELSMGGRESMGSFLERVQDILERCRRSGIAKSDDVVIRKLLNSLSRTYDDAAPLLKEMMNLPDMTLKDLLDIYDLFGDRPQAMPHLLKGFYISLKKAKSEQMWCGLCKKYNHNEEDCYCNPMAVNSSGGRGRQFKRQCHHCGERGHYARDCSTRTATQAQIDQKRNAKPEHFMLGVTMGGFTFDEDMWMIYTNASNHMTPNVKFFTTLDTTYKARVGLADGMVIMAQGKGDVSILMKGVRKIIKNVLFVPRLNRNVLSVSQMTSRGYTVIMGADQCTIKDETGKVFATTIWEERGIALRLQVIKGNLTF